MRANSDHSAHRTLAQLTSRFALAIACGSATLALARLDVPTCQTVTLPDDAILLPDPTGQSPCPKTTGDGGIAVGTDAIVLTSNCGVQVRCQDGGTWDDPELLEGANLSLAMFRREAEHEIYNDIFDPRVIWDGFDNRFWVVAMEWFITDPGGIDPTYLDGRIHVAVSTDSEPRNVSTTYWNKFTNGGQADPLDPHESGHGDALAYNSFPDRTQIAVDEKYLYICLTERDGDNNKFDERDLVVIIEKASMMDDDDGTDPTIEAMLFIDVDGEGEGTTWGHTLAVDYDIEDDDIYKVYTMALAYFDADDTTTDHTQIRFGAVYYDEDNSEWKYEPELFTLPTSPSPNKKFRNTESAIPGGPGGTDTNPINQSIFWNACTRIVGETRYVWAIHHVRAYQASSGSKSALQWYVVQPNDFPCSTCGDPDPDLVSVARLSNSNYFYHDPSIASNGNGDIAIYFNRSAGDQGNLGYPRIYCRLIPADCAGNATSALVRTGPNQAYTNSGAWIDFSGAAPDPESDEYFWGHSMVVYDADQFQTVVDRSAIPACRPGPDRDGDGEVTLSDLHLFQAMAAAGDASADLDGSGQIDTLDWLFILDALDHGETLGIDQ